MPEHRRAGEGHPAALAHGHDHSRGAPADHGDEPGRRQIRRDGRPGIGLRDPAESGRGRGSPGAAANPWGVDTGAAPADAATPGACRQRPAAAPRAGSAAPLPRHAGAPRAAAGSREPRPRAASPMCSAASSAAVAGAARAAIRRRTWSGSVLLLALAPRLEAGESRSLRRVVVEPLVDDLAVAPPGDRTCSIRTGEPSVAMNSITLSMNDTSPSAASALTVKPFHSFTPARNCFSRSTFASRPVSAGCGSPASACRGRRTRTSRR